jgi:hypothetical protein
MNTRSFFYIFFFFLLSACGNLNHSDSAASLNETVDHFTDVFSSGQNNNHHSVLVGNLGKKAVNLEIKRDGDRISGKYLSPITQKELRLEGEINRQQQNRFEIREYDQEGNQLGAFRGNLKFNKKYQGEWVNMRGNVYTPFEFQTKKEVFLMASPTQRSNQKIEVEYRTSKLESPDKLCQIIDHYPVLTGFSDANTEKSINKLLKPAPLYERQLSLSQCIEQFQDLQFDEGARTENSVSINMVTSQLMSITSYHTEFDPESQRTNISSNVINVDPQTGRTFLNEDLFVENYADILTNLIKQKLNEKYEHEWGLDFDGINPEKACAFFPDKLLVTFNPYELGDHSPGQIHVFLSYVEMTDVINPYGPLADFITGQAMNPSGIQVE